MIFIKIFKIPWYFQVFQVYSRFSRFSRSSWNPVKLLFKIEIFCCHKSSSKYKIALYFVTITHRLPPLRPHWTTTVLCSWPSWLSSCPCSACPSVLSCVCRFCESRRSAPTRGRRRHRFSYSVSWTWFSHQRAPRHRLLKYSRTRVRRSLSRMVEYTVEPLLDGQWGGW